MGKIIIHNLTNEELIEKRKQEFLKLSFEERFFETLKLIRASSLFRVTNNSANKRKIIIKEK